MSPVSPQWPAILNWLNASGTQPPLLLTHQNTDILIATSAELALVSACTASSEKACRTCPPCRQVLHSSHPDTIIINPDTNTIPIKTIRQLLSDLSLTSQTNRRLVFIHQAHKLSIPAINALLKTLEEPAASTRFVLTTPWPRRLLATIKSRCQQLRLTNPSASTTPASPTYSNSLLERLSQTQKKPLSDDMLADIAAALNNQLHQQGATPELTRAYQRLRDYYLIVNGNGNEQVTKDVLLASLPSQNH